MDRGLAAVAGFKAGELSESRSAMSAFGGKADIA